MQGLLEALILSLFLWETSRTVKTNEKSNGQKPAGGLQKIVCTFSYPVRPLEIIWRCSDVHFLEASSLSGDNVESPFLLAARAILLSIESGVLDPEKAGSGVSYGDRALRRVSSSSRLSFGSLSGGRRKGTVRLKVKGWVPGNKCC